MIATIIYFAPGNIYVLVEGPEKGAAETTIINFVQWLKLLVEQTMKDGYYGRIIKSAARNY